MKNKVMRIVRETNAQLAHELRKQQRRQEREEFRIAVQEYHHRRKQHR